MKALVVGGSGPTGPHVVSGLRERGYDVTIFHRGVHELPELDDLEHIHADPHFEETIVAALGGRRFDLVVAMYGRLRHVAAAVAGACDVFIGISGIPVYRGQVDPASNWPRGVAVLSPEDAPKVSEVGHDASSGMRFSHAIYAAEQAVLDLGAGGAFRATLFRYPGIYGPRQLYPSDWSIIKRVLDGRRYVILPDNGLTITTRCAARNAAEFVLLAVDHPQNAAGAVFNVADDRQFTLRQWTQLTSTCAGRELEVVSIPFEFAGPARDLFPFPHDDSSLYATDKARKLLGYRDVITSPNALEQEVAWYVEHPPGEDVLARMKDRFDYNAEDSLLAQWADVTAGLLAAQETGRELVHPYPHPKQPGASRDERGR